MENYEAYGWYVAGSLLLLNIICLVFHAVLRNRQEPTAKALLEDLDKIEDDIATLRAVVLSVAADLKAIRLRSGWDGHSR